MPVWTSSKISSAPAASHASRVARSTSSGTTCTPLSPRMGSTITAAVFSSTASGSASIGTARNPGTSGANGACLLSWGVALSAPYVRPWKPPWTETISPPGRRLRASFSAASLASAPELEKKTPPPSERSTSRAASRSPGSLKYRLPTCMSRSVCSRTAATTAGWQCPRLVTEMPHRKSRYSLPSASHRRAPSPRTKVTGFLEYVGRNGSGRGTDLRPDARVGEQLEQQRVRDAAVDDVRERHAAVDGLQAGRELGPHPARDVLQRTGDLVRAGLGDDAGRVGGVAQPALDVGEEHDLVGAQRAGDGAGRLVGVDVVGVTLAVGAHRGDHRDVVRGDVLEQIDVDALDRAHETNVLAARRRLAGHPEQRAVVPAQADGGLAVAVQAQHDVLVDLADEDHLGHLDRGLVGDPQAADELHREVQPLHVGGNVGPAAVDDDRVHADELEQHHVAGELLTQRRIDHRRAPVLDDDGLAVEVADVRQRLEERRDIVRLAGHPRILGMPSRPARPSVS